MKELEIAWHLKQHAFRTHRLGAALLSALAASMLSAPAGCLHVVHSICQPTLPQFGWLVHDTTSVQFLALQAIATLGALPHLVRLVKTRNEIIAEGA